MLLPAASAASFVEEMKAKFFGKRVESGAPRHAHSQEHPPKRCSTPRLLFRATARWTCNLLISTMF
jgi:hypothetical protein